MSPETNLALVTEPMETDQISWLLGIGVPAKSMMRPTLIMQARGSCDDGRYFEPNPSGDKWLAFDQIRDVVFWQPRTNKFATWHARAFALNEDAIDNPATYAFDCELRIHASPFDWLISGRDGIVIFDWSMMVFERLRDAPRIAVSSRVLSKYRSAMRPAFLPEVSVMVDERKDAA